MAACSLLDGQGSYRALVVHRDVVKEFVIGVREILSDKRATRFFSCQAALHRSGDQTDGGLSSQHLEKIGVGDQGVLVEVKGFGRDTDLLQFGQQAGMQASGWPTASSAPPPGLNRPCKRLKPTSQP